MNIKEQIKGNIEMFVNCIYDNENSGWLEATLEKWIKAVYEETITWYNDEGNCYMSNVNRFNGKEKLIEEIKKQLIKRLKELKKEGYEIKAL